MSEKIIHDIVKTIVDEVSPEKILLFGSRARGNAHQNSDIDLLIIEKQPFDQNRSRWQELIKIRRALKNYRVSKDILLFSSDEVEYWKNSINHIIPTCLSEGKVVYER